MIASNSILYALAQVGKLFYDRMIARLNAGNYPKDNPERGFSSIQNATTVSPPMSKGKDHHYIDIVIDLKKAPYAGAFEFGSGEHGEGGGAYKIKPKNVSVLAFPEEDWPGFAPPVRPGKKMIGLLDGTFLLREVDHPGIAAKSYIKPTLQEVKPEARKILAREFKAFILSNVKAIEVIK